MKKSRRPDQRLLALIVFLLCYSLAFCFGCAKAYAWTEDKMADAIYLAEGGEKTRFPYGVQSIETNGDKDLARRITINSVRNNLARWEKAERPGDFVDFMARRWCPYNQRVWAKNVRYFLEKE